MGIGSFLLYWVVKALCKCDHGESESMKGEHDVLNLNISSSILVWIPPISDDIVNRIEEEPCEIK